MITTITKFYESFIQKNDIVKIALRMIFPAHELKTFTTEFNSCVSV